MNNSLSNNSPSAFDPGGIEVSQLTLVVALRCGDHDESPREFPNTSEGHQAVLRCLARSGRSVRVAMESTGLYGLDLALTLHQAGVALMVANPRAVRHFAQALLQRSKNDHLDAQVLREYAARMPFQVWRPPSAAALKLVAVEFVLSDPQLARRFELLLSIPGFGTTSALHTLAELTLLPAGMDVRQWVAYAGLDPREYSSGTSVHKKVRISKAGNKHLRRALYMPALVAVQHQPHLRAFYEHLLARGKTKMQALVATMRKLLHAIFGMFKHDQLFDGSKVYALADASNPVPQEVLA